MNLVTALLTNGAYGYPTSDARRRKATILACLQETANTATAVQRAGLVCATHSSSLARPVADDIDLRGTGGQLPRSPPSLTMSRPPRALHARPNELASPRPV